MRTPRAGSHAGPSLVLPCSPRGHGPPAGGCRRDGPHALGPGPRAVGQLGPCWPPDGRWGSARRREGLGDGADRHGRFGFPRGTRGATYDVCAPSAPVAALLLAQHADRAEALRSTYRVPLPVGGCTLDGPDVLFIWPQASGVGISDRLSIVPAAGLCWAPWSRGPRRRRAPMEDAMATVEQRLGTSTLWRAPHDRATVGLPDLQLSMHSLVDGEGGPRFRPLPRTVDEALTDGGATSGLAHAMALEGEAVGRAAAQMLGGRKPGSTRGRGAPAAGRTASPSTYGEASIGAGNVMRWRGRLGWDDEPQPPRTLAGRRGRLQARLGGACGAFLFGGAAGVAHVVANAWLPDANRFRPSGRPSRSPRALGVTGRGTRSVRFGDGPASVVEFEVHFPVNADDATSGLRGFRSATEELMSHRG
ncbi:MAG: hypothetical protein CM15mP128_4660 [Methanobacteriota archaeon]|nr:MAG: hypothetical protein CM15mP128_4660 [Euryarchaeota archaeon]